MPPPSDRDDRPSLFAVSCREGDRLGGRFRLERLAGEGGMGVVWRARDESRGDAPVALKMIHASVEGETARFADEASVLAQLDHPAVVRLIDFQVAGERPYIAMEWLEGEDLAHRLARAPVSGREALELVRRIAEGLAVAHGRGIVHRDIKPSNLFLEGGDPARARLLDFGVARLAGRGRALTRTNAIIGTLGYMAPEQARGAKDLDARADVFALGCVLYECLVGSPAYAGPSPVAVLAKVLTELPPRLSEVRADVPAELDRLLFSMLSKRPEDRPEDAGAVARLLAAIRLDERVPSGARAEPRRSLVGASIERRMVTVVLVSTRPHAADSDPTLTPDEMSRVAGQVEALAGRFSAVATPIAGGSFILSMPPGGAVTDRATQAVSCALEIARAVGEARVVVATGHVQAMGSSAGGLPVGPAIDRAAGLLALPARPSVVRLDDTTEGLLGDRFVLEGAAGDRVALGKVSGHAPPRRLLGRRTPCVGREKELGLLVAAIAASAEESEAGALLVLASPGVGKSRLLREVLERVEADGATRVLVGRADPLTAASPLSLLRGLVGEACGTSESAAASERAEAILGRLRHVMPDRAAAELTAQFLAEVAGAPVAQPLPTLAAARKDPGAMREGVRRSLVDWLAAEAKKTPVLLAIEDVHWSDPASVEALGEVLRRLSDLPVFLLAVGRPEAQRTVTAAWPNAQELSLGPLSRRASERLVRSVLPELGDEPLGRLVTLSQGNAFYLEELTRRMAERGEDAGLPETVLAMSQSRLDDIEPGARRVLRLASVIGASFEARALEWLLDPGEASPALRPETLDALEALVRAELLEAMGRGATEGDRSFAFRHALLREAAYASSSDDERRSGHRRAAEWLIAHAAIDAVRIAEHLERAEERARALPWALRALERGMSGTVADIEALAARAMALGPSEREGLHVEACLLVANTFSGRAAEGLERARRLIMACPPGSSDWWLAASTLGQIAGSSAEAPAELGLVVGLVLDVERELFPEGYARWMGISLLGLGAGLGLAGQREIAEMLERRVLAFVPRYEAEDPSVRVLGDLVSLNHAAFLRGSPGEALALARRVAAAATAVGDPQLMGGACSYGVFAHVAAASFEEALRIAERGLPVCRASGNALNEAWTLLGVATAQVFLGEHDAAIATFSAVLEGPIPPAAGFALAGLAYAHLSRGDAEAAERLATTVEAALGALALGHGVARLVRARVALGRGEAAAALEHAEAGIAASERYTQAIDRVALRTVRAEALGALGRGPEAEAAMRDALATLDAQAASFERDDDRSTFLEKAPWAREALTAAERLGVAREG